MADKHSQELAIAFTIWSLMTSVASTSAPPASSQCPVGWPANPLHTVTINHVTGFQDADGSLMSVGNQNYNPPMYGFVFTNNIVTTAGYWLWSVGGGKTSCAHSGTPAQKIANCFAT